ncbi:MAG: CRISPR-associated endonuclease Cas2 [Candidatus Yanofskybacteria bacterium]|nr:CRISPR-associated endonuclease Cas2 [Candidatus Yanofskybacteria bacterium]
MKGDFIPKFIEAIIKTGKEFHETWNWEPLYYKGIRVSGHNRRRADYGLSNLKQRGIVGEVSEGKYKFTKKGRMWFNKSLIKYHKRRGTKWDRKWRVVIFDIPQEMHKKRNNFRYKLKYLGFFMLQKSVFVLPYPCEEELGYVCQGLDINDYVDVIIADSIGFRESEIKKHFEIL